MISGAFVFCGTVTRPKKKSVHVTHDGRQAPMVGGKRVPKPSQDVRHMTLGMTGVWDVYRKFEWEVDVFRQAVERKVLIGPDAFREIRYPMHAAINAAATAWSMIEWLWWEVELSSGDRCRLLTAFGVAESGGVQQLKHGLREQFPEINACHQIAHASKHAQLTDVTPGFSAEISFGVWESATDLYWSAHGEVRYIGGGEVVPIEEVFDFMLSWWSTLLIDLEVADRAKIVPGSVQVR